jgi:hypothetical protein
VIQALEDLPEDGSGLAVVIERVLDRDRVGLGAGELLEAPAEGLRRRKTGSE